MSGCSCLRYFKRWWILIKTMNSQLPLKGTNIWDCDHVPQTLKDWKDRERSLLVGWKMSLAAEWKWEAGRARGLRGDQCLTTTATTNSGPGPQNGHHFPPSASQCPRSPVQCKHIWNSVHFFSVYLSTLFPCMHLDLNSSIRQFSLNATQPPVPHCLCPHCISSWKIPASPPSAVLYSSVRTSSVTPSADASLVPFCSHPKHLKPTGFCPYYWMQVTLGKFLDLSALVFSIA